MSDVPRVQTLEPARAGDVVVSFSISPEGQAVVAWASAEDSSRLHARDSQSGASFPRTILDRPATLRVTIERWSNGIAGAHAMLASGKQVALIGGYSGERDRVVVGSLEHGVLRPLAEGRLTVGGQPWSGVDRMFARDGMLHALAGNCWHTIDLWRLFAVLG